MLHFRTLSQRQVNNLGTRDGERGSIKYLKGFIRSQCSCFIRYQLSLSTGLFDSVVL